MKLAEDSICKNRKQMAAEYGIDPRTFVRLLRVNKIEIEGKTITPAQQEMIYKILGYPQKQNTFDKTL